MAFLCPSRLGYPSRAKRTGGREPTPRGRITGSDSIDTIEQIGLDKQSYKNSRTELNIVQDFNPKAAGEVPVRKGDQAHLICTAKDWFYIEKSNGQTGYVPQSVCYSFIHSTDTELSRATSVCSSSVLSEYSADLSQSNTDTESTITRNMSPLFKSTDTVNKVEKITTFDKMDVKPFYKTSHGQYIVLFDFLGLNENDVSVERAELVEVLNIEDPDWSWVRKYDALEGFVPKTYICPVEPLRILVRNGGISRKNDIHNQQTSDSQSFNVVQQPKNKVDYDIIPKHVSHDESLSSTSVQSHFAVDQSFDNLKKGKKPKLQPYIHNRHDDSLSSTSVQSHFVVDQSFDNLKKGKIPKLQPYILNNQSEIEPLKQTKFIEPSSSMWVQSHFEVDQSFDDFKRDKISKLQPYINNNQREIEPLNQATGPESLSSTSVQSHFEINQSFANLNKDKTTPSPLYNHNSQSELEPLKQRIGLESLSSTNVQSNFADDKSFAKLKKGKKPKLQPYIHNSHDDSFSSTGVQSNFEVDQSFTNLQKDKTAQLQPYIHNSQSELEPFKSATGLESLSSTNVQSHFEVDQSVTKLKKDKVPNSQSYIHNSQHELEPWKQATVLEEKPICNMTNKRNENIPKNKETIPKIKLNKEKCGPFQNVSEELAVILKRRQQMSEAHVSDTSWRTTINKSSLSTRWSSESSVNLTNDTDKKPASKPKTKRCNMVEYVMKYEYKGQAHGQQNIYLQKGEAIYADLNSQNSTEWIWVHIPRTNQFGYVPSSYAERQTTVVL